jgi:hypothetical protein
MTVMNGAGIGSTESPTVRIGVATFDTHETGARAEASVLDLRVQPSRQ